jgi:hypothetical protein
MAKLMFQFEYRKLGDFTYNILADSSDIKPFLMHWLTWEWSIDHQESPEQIWTVEWLELLPQMSFTLEVLALNDIQPRPDLMNYKTESESFVEDLQARAEEREVSMLRGVSIEPIVVNQSGFELMDGYTRYTVLKQYQQKEVYAYVGKRR